MKAEEREARRPRQTIKKELLELCDLGTHRSSLQTLRMQELADILDSTEHPAGISASSAGKRRRRKQRRKSTTCKQTAPLRFSSLPRVSQSLFGVSVSLEVYQMLGFLWRGSVFCAMHGSTVDTVQTSVEAFWRHFSRFHVNMGSGSLLKPGQPAVTCPLSAWPDDVEANWIAMGNDFRYHARIQRAWLDSGYTLTRHSIGASAEYPSFLGVIWGHCGGQRCQESGSLRIQLGVLCYPGGGISVGADFAWIPRGTLCSADHELHAVRWHVRFLWLRWWLD